MLWTRASAGVSANIRRGQSGDCRIWNQRQPKWPDDRPCETALLRSVQYRQVRMLCQRYEVAIVAGVGYSYCHSFSSCFAVKFRPNPQRRNRHWYWGTVTDKTSSNNRSYHLSLLPYVGRLGSRRTPPRGSDRVRSTGYCKFKKKFHWAVFHGNKRRV